VKIIFSKEAENLDFSNREISKDVCLKCQHNASTNATSRSLWLSILPHGIITSTAQKVESKRAKNGINVYYSSRT